MRRTNLPMVLALASISGAFAQGFSSGSTGADGALNVAGPSGATVQLPPSGVLNYTTVNVASGYELSFSPNAANTPVTILATGAVTIAGLVDVSGTPNSCVAPGRPGPGGFYGGAPGQSGVGPGGGVYGSANPNGKWVGPLNLVPIIGGSGSAAYSTTVAGGGGGGAIVIASSVSITVTNTIQALGAQALNCGYGYGPFGSDGAIRLVSNSVNVSGTLQAAVVRLEGPSGGVLYTGTGTTPVIAPINPVIVPVNAPTIAITSIGGYPAPPTTGASWRTVDLLLPTQLQDPLAVIVQGTNVPVGSQVSLTFSGSAATASPPSGILNGTLASSSATFYVSGLSRAGITVIFAVVTFDPNQMATNLKQSGPDAVRKVELAAALGGPVKYRFLRADGSEVAPAKLAPELKRIFGL